MSAPLLQVTGLSVTLGDRLVLDSVSFELRHGRVLAVLGPNGAGKSTLLDALAGVRSPGSGEVRIEGALASALGPAQRARRVALVGREQTGKTMLSAREVVELGRLPHLLEPTRSASKRDHAEVSRALQEADCVQFAERQLSTLSEGERQRIAWARALAQQPRLLLLDEATAHLDLAHRERALARVRSFVGKDRGALVVVHDVDLAVRHCDHTLLLHQGRLRGIGPTLELLTPTLLARVYGIDAEIQRTDRGPHLRVYGSL